MIYEYTYRVINYTSNGVDNHVSVVIGNYNFENQMQKHFRGPFLIDVDPL